MGREREGGREGGGVKERGCVCLCVKREHASACVCVCSESEQVCV